MSVSRIVACLVLAVPAAAHFQVLIPTTDSVAVPSDRMIALDLRFTHPMAGGPVMPMEQPTRFGVIVRGENHDLKSALNVRTLDGVPSYTTEYEVAQPGAHVFYVEPAPYFESDENTFIIHYTKVVVDGFNAWSGWDTMVGFPVEIRPLTRPYGLWAGNAFQGIVMKGDRAVPFAHVEVERLNDDHAVSLPSAVFETQVIKTDANGVFTYVMPTSGWWGFAALIEGDQTMTAPDGGQAAVELGALMWVHATAMNQGLTESANAHP